MHSASQSVTPHVTLLVAEGYESHELVNAALQMQEWMPTANKYINLSPDKQFIRLSIRAYDEGLAEKVFVDERLPMQINITTEHETLLQQVTVHVWSKHKTDVGCVISAHPVHIKLKQGVNLPYKWQYPLRQQIVEGIKPTVEVW